MCSIYARRSNSVDSDRVRAIALAMGLIPVIWTRTPSAGQFDSDGTLLAASLSTLSSYIARLGGGCRPPSGTAVGRQL